MAWGSCPSHGEKKGHGEVREVEMGPWGKLVSLVVKKFLNEKG